MAIEVLPEWLSVLDDEDVNFIKNFLLSSGSIKEIAKIYGVTYPTLRLKLDKLIQKIKLGEKTDSDPFVNLIKKLAIEEKIDLYAAKLLIAEYKKRKDDLL